MPQESQPISTSEATRAMFPDAIPLDTASGQRSSASNSTLFGSGLWWLAFICIVFGVGLFGWQWSTRGPEIVVRFREGHGVKAENRLMHRGIEVGAVEKVEPTADLDFVDVHIRIVRSAKSLMREGSLFWIERPTLSFQGARGLDTILSGRYVAVEPGPKDGAYCRAFQGLDQPLLNRMEASSLELVLEGNTLHGLQVDAPIIYRGLSVGRVQSVGLSADGRFIQVRAGILADYRNLVRTNSRFWNRTGFRIEVGLSGVDIDAESLAGIAAGGIEFATPDPPGESVKDGQRFELAEKADEDWKSWRPRLLHGNNELETFGELPLQERLTITWKEERLLGFRRTQSKRGWLLPLDDGTIIGPRSLFVAPSSAVEGSVRWEMGGQEWDATRWSFTEPSSQDTTNPCARVSLSDAAFTGPKWSTKRIGVWQPELLKTMSPSPNGSHAYPLWIVGDIPTRWLPIERHQVDASGGPPWKLEVSLGLDEDRHGAVVLDGVTGSLIGIVDIQGANALIVPIQTR